MKKYFVLAVIISLSPLSSNAQAHFVSNNYESYYEWFHQRSQVAMLYTDGSSLYTFNATKVKELPCEGSKTSFYLPIGTKVTNIVDESEDFVRGNINGYDDIWFHVKGKNSKGEFFEGYVWGADIARSWQSVDITADGLNEFILLGISSKRRKKTTDINATLKVLKNGKLYTETNIPGLCLFEECASSSLVRVLENQPGQGAIIIEASTMTIGCTAGIEKVYYFWNASHQLERIFHAEFSQKKQIRNKSFEFEGNNGRFLCRYSHEDENYNPVWDVKQISGYQGGIVRVARKKKRT